KRGRPDVVLAVEIPRRDNMDIPLITSGLLHGVGQRAVSADHVGMTDRKQSIWHFPQIELPAWSVLNRCTPTKATFACAKPLLRSGVRHNLCIAKRVEKL